MATLAELAATKATPKGKSWNPPPEAIPDILAARANGYGWVTIAKALTADGIVVGKNGVQSWFERHERSTSDGTD